MYSSNERGRSPASYWTSSSIGEALTILSSGMKATETEEEHRDTEFTETHKEETQTTDRTNYAEAAAFTSAVAGLRPAGWKSREIASASRITIRIGSQM